MRFLKHKKTWIEPPPFQGHDITFSQAWYRIFQINDNWLSVSKDLADWKMICNNKDWAELASVVVETPHISATVQKQKI